MHVISFGGRPELPSHVTDLAEAAEARAGDLRATEDVKGGLRRDDLLAALAPVVRASGLTVTERESFAAREVDAVDATDAVALSVQAGRARTNNGGLLAVLAAAAMDDVSWLLLLLPQHYKNSVAAQPVTDDLERLARTPGVRLALEAVVVITY